MTRADGVNVQTTISKLPLVESAADRFQRRLTLLGLLVALPCAVIVGWIAADPLPGESTRNASTPQRPAPVNIVRAAAPAPVPVTAEKPVVAAHPLKPATGYEPLAIDIADAAVEARLSEDVAYLSHDDRQGRGVGTEGLDQAAEYIASAFGQAGLRTDLYDGQPYHEFMLTPKLGLGSTNELKISGPDGNETAWSVGREFTPLSLSGSANFNVPLVFVGYGITAPPLEYDDYHELDVQGKAVIILRHEPQQSDPDSKFEGLQHTQYAFFAQKVSNAADHGAAAVILVTDAHEIETRRLEHRGSEPDENAIDPLLQFQVGTSLGRRRIPVVHCRRSAVEPLVELALGESLESLEKQIDESGQAQSRPLTGWNLQGAVSVIPKGRTLKNVIAALPGTDPADGEVVVVGAHYDHLGLGGWGSLSSEGGKAIHNGADDNASGTAVLMEIARLLAARPEPLRRHVLFMAFTAEEMGLIGSKRYVQNPLVPLQQTVAMVNLDMVGRLRKDELTMYGTGTARQFSEMVDRLGAAYDLKLRHRPSGYGPSDHASFYERGVPVLHLFTGFHPQYHRPDDDFETLNIPGMGKLARYTADIVAEIATAEERPQPSASGDVSESLAQLAPIERAGAQPADAGRPANVSRSLTGAPPKAYLGVVIDRTYNEAGYGIARVIKGGPAERAGLRAGDVVLRFGPKEVLQPKDLIDEISRSRAGAPTSLTIRRGSLEFDATVILAEVRR
ncbi:M28 family peptidase [Planctellipticum variicoloris]|uniref:M28 family peptidase n=1 Tax=Planctellipticum variicoloris TaxID=3064265 RepID=UPI003013A400|nr:M28 family peptidase [Planctomycetaceae bacterium SH412]